MTTIPAAIQEQLNLCQEFKRQIDLEVNFRKTTGRPNNKNLAIFATEELENDRKWYENRVDQLLAEYEQNGGK